MMYALAAVAKNIKSAVVPKAQALHAKPIATLKTKRISRSAFCFLDIFSELR
jgi:hypothetical protein